MDGIPDEEADTIVSRLTEVRDIALAIGHGRIPPDDQPAAQRRMKKLIDDVVGDVRFWNQVTDNGRQQHGTD